MIENIDIDALNGKQLITINSKLPRPKQRIYGDLTALPITIRLGVRIDLDAKSIWHDKQSTIISVDGKLIAWGFDSTKDFIESDQGEFHKVIGDGWITPRHQTHMGSMFSPTFFLAEYGSKTVDLSERDSWCLTMSRKDLHRDYICDQLDAKYHHTFEGKQWFCYDGGSEYTSLRKYMFRKPYKNYKDRTDITDANDERMKYSNNDVDKNDPVYYWVDGRLGPWHKQSLIELVPEGTVEYFEPTEKIIKPISAGMPFVVVGSHKFLYRLRKIGFKTFAPYIDETYDEVVDWKTRIETAMSSMFAFVQSPSNLTEIQQICDHNRKVLQQIRTHDWQMRIVKKLRPYVS